MTGGRLVSHRLRYQIFGVVFLLTAALFLAFTVAIYRKSFTPYVPVVLQTDHAGSQMRGGADVKVRGVVVGEVRSIEQSSGHASLHLALQPDMASMIPVNVSAQLLPKTLFGERYVALEVPERPSGAHLTAGAVIAQDRSSSAMEIEQVLDDLMPLLQTVQPQELSTTLSAVSQALQGRGAQMGQTMVQLNGYLHRLNPSLPDLQSVIARMATVSNTYAQATPDFMQALDNLSVTSRTVVQQRADLDNMFHTLTTSSVDLSTFLEVNQNNLIRLSATSRPTLELLARYAPEYPCMLNQLVAGIPKGETAFGKGSDDHQKVTLQFTGSRGKYVPGRDTPQYLDQRGPRCYPFVEPPNVFPQYPPGGPVQDGSMKPAPPRGGLEVPHAPAPGAPAGTTAQSAPGNGKSAPTLANSPEEQNLLAALLAPQLGVPPRDVPAWSGLLVGPLFRGAEVELR